MPGHDPLAESEVRDVVRRIVEGVLDAGAAPSPPTGAEVTTPSEREPGDGAAVAIGADHGGFELKQRLISQLQEAGHDVVDCGTYSPDSVDYPEFAHTVARRVADGSCQWGVVVDGAGIGSAMVANKVPGIRAALCYDLSSARNSREHNHANVLTLGASLIGPGLAWQIVQEWLSVPWGPDRHARRVAMISEIERRYSASPAGAPA